MYTHQSDEEKANRKGRELGSDLLFSSCLKTKFMYTIFGILSIITGTLVILFGGFVTALISPMILLSYIFKYCCGGSSSSTPTHNNLSFDMGGSMTALIVLSMRTTTYQCGYGPDYIAPQLMSQLSMFPGCNNRNILGSIYISQLAILLQRVHFRLTGRSLSCQLAYLCKLPISEAYLHGRTCFMDDVVNSFIEKVQMSNDNGKVKGKGKEANIVILGAGYDTRFYRLHGCLPPRNSSTATATSISESTLNLHLYEIDAIGTQTEKLRVLAEAGIHNNHVTYVPIDFQKENWLHVLIRGSDSGSSKFPTAKTAAAIDVNDTCATFDVTLATLVLWEGVTYYLPKRAVQTNLRIFNELACQNNQSVIAFDYFGEWSKAEILTSFMQKLGESWLFSVNSERELTELLENNSGLQRQEQEQGQGQGQAQEQKKKKKRRQEQEKYDEKEDEVEDDGKVHSLVIREHVQWQECIRRYVPYVTFPASGDISTANSSHKHVPFAHIGDFGGFVVAGKKQE